MLKRLGGAFVLAAGLAGLAPAPVAADSFGFSYSSGGRGGHHGGHYRGHHGWNHGGWNHGGWNHGYRYRPYVYDPYPTVIYEEPFYEEPVYLDPIEYRGEYRDSYQPPARQKDTCREYQTRIKIDGRYQRAYGTSCLQPDGTWKNVD